MAASGTHVIVVGNEKGGSGKSTTAFHLAILLLHQGFNVATIDVDSRQQTLTRYVRNRSAWAAAHKVELLETRHYHLPISRSETFREKDNLEFQLFREAVMEVEGTADYLIIDTPGFDTHLSRLSHSIADTLITPLNDSLVDLDVVAELDPATGRPARLSHYARLVQRARTERREIDGKVIDWVLVRNRVASLSSRNTKVIISALQTLAGQLDARLTDGVAERVLYRSLFTAGLTVFDPLDAPVIADRQSEAVMRARVEYSALLRSLQLPHTARKTGRSAHSDQHEVSRG